MAAHTGCAGAVHRLPSQPGRPDHVRQRRPDRLRRAKPHVDHRRRPIVARGEITIYRHGDVDHAARLVAQAPGRVLVVTDTVFSMDGDVAKVAELSELCARTGALLVLDDAHLAGLQAFPSLTRNAACLRSALSPNPSALSAGYVVGPARWMELLVNRARSFIFTTALSPADTAAASAAVEVYRSSEGDKRFAVPPRPRRHHSSRPPIADHPRRSRRRDSGPRSRTAAARRRTARPGDPPPDGPRGHIQVAVVALSSPPHERRDTAGERAIRAGMSPSKSLSSPAPAPTSARPG